MNVSPDALRKETVQVLHQVNAQIREVEEVAASRGKKPEQMRDNNGGWVLTPLLLTKAQCLQTLTLLNEKRR